MGQFHNPSRSALKVGASSDGCLWHASTCCPWSRVASVIKLAQWTQQQMQLRPNPWVLLFCHCHCLQQRSHMWEPGKGAKCKPDDIPAGSEWPPPNVCVHGNHATWSRVGFPQLSFCPWLCCHADTGPDEIGQIPLSRLYTSALRQNEKTLPVGERITSMWWTNLTSGLFATAAWMWRAKHRRYLNFFSCKSGI